MPNNCPLPETYLSEMGSKTNSVVQNLMKKSYDIDICYRVYLFCQIIVLSFMKVHNKVEWAILTTLFPRRCGAIQFPRTRVVQILKQLRKLSAQMLGCWPKQHVSQAQGEKSCKGRQTRCHLETFFAMFASLDFSVSASFWAFFFSSSACLRFSSCAFRNIRTKLRRVETTAKFWHQK